jgi:hypothetical protein
MPNLTLATQVCRSSNLLTSEIDGEVVMMSLEQSSYYGLDVIGSRIWQLLAEPLPVSELVAKLLEEYDVDALTCQRDVLALLEQMHAQNLIQAA